MSPSVNIVHGDVCVVHWSMLISTITFPRSRITTFHFAYLLCQSFKLY